MEACCVPLAVVQMGDSWVGCCGRSGEMLLHKNVFGRQSKIY